DIGIRSDAEHRTEELVASNGHIGGNVSQDGRTHEVAFVQVRPRLLFAAMEDPGTSVLANLDLRQDIVQTLRRHQGTKLRFCVPWIAHGNALSHCCKIRYKLIVKFGRDEQGSPGEANLGFSGDAWGKHPTQR